MSECHHEDCGYGKCYERDAVESSYAEGERAATERIIGIIEAIQSEANKAEGFGQGWVGGVYFATRRLLREIRGGQHE
jgi:hypothetical protein